MASGGAKIAWGFTRFLVGLLLWCFAGLFVFVLLDGAMPLWAAITVATLVMLGLPTLLTRLLIPAFQKLGERPRWIELWPGLCGVVALLALVGPPLFARPFSARKLSEISQHHRAAPAWVLRATAALARWLAPAQSTPPHPVTAHRDGAVDGDAVAVRVDGASPDAHRGEEDASTVIDAASDDSSDALVADDGSDAASDSDAQDDSSAPPDAAITDAPAVDDAVALVAQSDDEDAGEDPPQDAAVATPIDPHGSQADLQEFARLSPCSSPSALWMGELALGGTDELVVSCSDGVHVFYLQNDGVVERSVFSPRTPAGQSLALPRALVADIDGDGRRDLGICLYFTSERGGTRGGNVLWARGKTNGQFEAPRVLVSGGIDCGGMEFGDVNGDQRPELLLIKQNNAYAATNRDSELWWYAGQGTQWTQRGRVRLARGADAMWLDDVTRDGILDVIVHAGWDMVSRNWVVAGARRGPSGVVNVTDVGSEPRAFVHGQGRLDNDGRTDVARIENGALVLWRTSDDDRPARTSASRALDFEEFEF